MVDIICLSGWIGSGKDTVADYLCQKYNYQQESFAKSLKDAVSLVFGWDRELLEGKTAEARAWRDQIDTWWAERLCMPTLTPRWILQYWGTDLCRKNFHDDIWIASLENRIRTCQHNIIITDCRFPNEMKVLKKFNARNVWIKRGELPTWYQTAIQALNGNILAQTELKQLNIHESEYAWINNEFDAIIENNGTLDDLYNQIENNIIKASL